jgi:hypothetical protein
MLAAAQTFEISTLLASNAGVGAHLLAAAH